VTAVFTRKFNRAKWDPAPDLDAGEIAADAVTADLRTTGNELSFWDFPASSEAELKETVLALATAQDRLDKLDVAWIEQAAVLTEGLTVQPTLHHAMTPVESLKERHVDVTRLDMERLGRIAKLIQGAVAANQCRRFLKKEVLAVIVAAVQAGRVASAALKDDVRKAVEADLKSSK
jgi:hypothetical protein